MKCSECIYWQDNGSCAEIVEEYWSKSEKDNSITIDYGVDDDSDLYINLITGPNFGCIKFNKRSNS